MRSRSFLMLLVLSGVGMSAPPLAAQSQPDVLFIAIDDLNDWVGVMGGHPQTKTPSERPAGRAKRARLRPTGGGQSGPRALDHYDEPAGWRRP